MAQSWRGSPSSLAVALACGALFMPGTGAAQVGVGIRVGAATSSHLVRDSIVESITVKPNAAPTIGLRVEYGLRSRFYAAADLGLAWSDLQSTGDSASTTITRLTLWNPMAAVGMTLAPWLSGEVRAGLLVYDPRERAGTLFSAGAPVEPTLGLGLGAEHVLGAAFRFGVRMQYDVHWFTTPALETRGYRGETTVHRATLSLTVTRGFGRATTTR